MTEAHEDGNYLVRVRAQVMMRDDSTGGWVPMGGGGLSNVSVRKHAVPCDLGENKHEYLIYGKRISDQSVVFSCTIKKDFEYNKVMPTFHHWKTGDKKFGLTFQTAADARAFDKGVRTAVEELLDDAESACGTWRFTFVIRFIDNAGWKSSCNATNGTPPSTSYTLCDPKNWGRAGVWHSH